MTIVSTALDAALTHHQSGEIEQAEDLCRVIIRLDPNHSEALYLLGVSAHQRGRTDEALSYINRAISGGAAGPVSQKKLGRVFQSLNRIDDAIQSYEKAVQLKPDDAETLFDLGGLYYESGNLEEAQRCYSQGLSITPNVPDVQSRLGRVLAYRSQFKESVKRLRHAIWLRPDCAESHYQLAEACVQAGNLDEATANYREALRLDPDFHRSCHRWSVVLNALEKVDHLSRTIQRFSNAASKDDSQKFHPNEVLQLRRKLDENIKLVEDSFTLQNRADEILEHATRGILNANWDYNQNSVPYVNLKNALPDQFFQELLANLPEGRSFRNQRAWRSNATEEANPYRVFSPDDESIAGLPGGQRKFWLHFTSMFHSELIRWTLFSKIRQQIPSQRQVFLVRGLPLDPESIRSVFPNKSIVVRLFLIRKEILSYPELLSGQDSAYSKEDRGNMKARVYAPNSGYIFEADAETSVEIEFPDRPENADSLVILFR